MPVMRCTKDGKPGYKYGTDGMCYVYRSGDVRSRAVAMKKARKQGAAIEIWKHTRADGLVPGQPRTKSGQFGEMAGAGDKKPKLPGRRDPEVSASLKRGSEDAFEGGLTNAEATSVSQYKSDDPYAAGAAINLNDKLRSGEPLDPGEAQAVENIDNAFRKAPRLKENTTVYRGTAEEMTNSGGFIDSDAYMSTSTSRKEADAFSTLTGDGDGYLYEISVPKNFAVMPTSAFDSSGSTISNEKELLLPRGAAIRVTGRSGRVIKAEVVGGSAWMLKPQKQVVR